MLGFYLNETTSNTTKYLTIEKIFPLLIMVKRQILELSHPYLNKEGDLVGGNDTNQCSKFSKSEKLQQPKVKSLIYRHHELFANFLIVISKLMSNNKHV